MTKDRYMALADLQSLWTDTLKPFISQNYAPLSGLDNKADKDGDAVEGNIAEFDNNGNPVDAGVATEDIAVNDGTYPDMTVGKSQNIFGSTQTNDTFVYRPTAGIQDIQSGQPGLGGAEVQKIEGNGVAWNQLVPDGYSEWSAVNCTYSISNNVVSVSGDGSDIEHYFEARNFQSIGNHVYYVSVMQKTPTLDVSIYDKRLFFIGGNAVYLWSTQVNVWNKLSTIITSSPDAFDIIRFYAPQNITVEYCYPQVIDLTLIFGVGNEPSTVVEFETWLANNVGLKDYYPYCAGELIGVNTIKVKTTGFNQWDEEVELGYYDASGNLQSADNQLCTKNYIRVIGGQTYKYKTEQNYVNSGNICYYDADKNFIARYDTSSIFVVPNGAAFAKMSFGGLYGTTYNHDICINLHHSGSRDGEYEPYWSEEKELEVGRIYGKLNGEGNPVKIWSDGVMKGINLNGFASDSINLAGNSAKVIVGKIDLGTIQWGLISGSLVTNNLRAFIADNVNFKGSENPSNILSSRYATCSRIGLIDEATGVTIDSNGIQGIIELKDTNITQSDIVNGYISKLGGVMFEYEKASPFTYTSLMYDTSTLGDGSQLVPLQEFAYAVDDYGTEELLLDNGTTVTECAPKMTIKYGINAADAIKNLPHNYVSVKAQSLSSSEKAQARQNIGACAVSDVPSSLADIGALSSIEAISVNTSSACSITGSSNAGKTQTIIYTNSGSSDLTVTVPTDYTTPDGQAIELTCKAGGYCEVSYLNVGGTIYARGL